MHFTLIRATGKMEYGLRARISISRSMLLNHLHWHLATRHATRPEEDSFISIDVPGVILSGIKQAEDGNELIVRLAEVEGKETIVNLALPVEIEKARRLNLVELPLDNVAKPTCSGKTLQVKIRAHEIVTLGITAQRN